MKNKAFSGFETGVDIPTGIMACEKGFPLFKEFLDYYNDRHFILEDGSYEFSFVMSETGAVRVIFGFATHTITKDETINGSFSCPSTADYNSVVTVTATPDPGYEVFEMFYCSASGLEVRFDSTFTMPDYDIIIFVAFSKSL